MKLFQPKLFTSLKSYSKKQVVNDLIAGVIVAIIALPLSIALAIASGVSPEKGLYTAIIAGFVIAFLGGSNVNISGPTAAFATIVAGIVAQFGTSGLVVATIMAGLILIIMGLLKFGSLDGVYENLNDPSIKPKLREKLESGKESAYLSYELATIVAEAPIDFEPKDAIVQPYNRPEL